MPISAVEFTRFNDLFISTLTDLGVDPVDGSLFRDVLDSFGPDIINPSYICGKYASALGVTQIALMQTIVTQVCLDVLHI